MTSIASGRGPLLAILLLFTNLVHAQAACPPGTIPYGTGQGQDACGPDDSEPQTVRQDSAQWMDQWGAIATAAAQGVIGVSTNRSTDADATQTALSDCSSKGGKNCEIELSYRNQCIAMVGAHLGYSVDIGLTSAIASKKSLKDCTDSGLTNCHVIYSDCSIPVRIQ